MPSRRLRKLPGEPSATFMRARWRFRRDKAMSDDEHAFLPSSRLPLAMALRKKAAQAEDSSEPTSHQIGLSAEGRAAAFLKGRGYRILFRRWRSPVGEIGRASCRERG